MPENDLKPGEFTYRDPKTLQPHPVSAALYLPGSEGWSIETKQMTSLEAANEIKERMDVSDILDNIKRGGIRVPLVVTPAGIIVSGCRRCKCAMLLGLTRVPVEIRTFENEIEEKQAILDYNCTREKTFSQKMREADLIKELASSKAKKNMLAGRKDPTLSLVEGQNTKRYSRETAAVVGSQIGLGKDTFRKAEQIWNKAKQGDPKAIELVEKLDLKTTNINAAFNILRKADKNRDFQELSKWQSAEPVGEGSSCICQTCGKSYRLVHCKSGRHRPLEVSESDAPMLRLQQQIKLQ